jgi:xanthine phosphoribosyltransferase
MILRPLIVVIAMLLSGATMCAHNFSKNGVDYTYVSYDDMDVLVGKLADIIKSSGHSFKGMVMITRGGLHGGNLLARKLRIKTFEVIGLESYGEDNSQKQIRVLKPLELENQGEGWLIFDDLSDTGNTFKFIENLFPKAMRACLYVKPQGKDMAHFHALEVPQKNWLTFAYEKALQDFLELNK